MQYAWQSMFTSCLYAHVQIVDMPLDFLKDGAASSTWGERVKDEVTLSFEFLQIKATSQTNI